MTAPAPGHDPGDGPTGLPRVTRSSAEVEAARLRYELARLRDRRPVRAALAVTSWRRDGVGPAVRALRGRPPRWDVPGPADVPAYPRYPHLRVGHLSSDPLVGGVVPAVHLVPGDLDAIERERIDLLLVDDVDGWDPAGLAEVASRARRVGAPVVAVGAPAVAALARAGATATVRVGAPGDAGVDLELPPAVDPRTDSPVGADPRVVAAEAVPPAGLLALAARGQVPVATEDTARRILLGPFADRLLVPSDEPDAVGERVAALDADEDDRDALSVALRRHVLTAHGRAARTDAVLSAAGVAEPPQRAVGLLLATRRPELLPGVVEDLARQSWQAVELVVAVHGTAPVPGRLALAPHAVVSVPTGRPLGAVLNAALERTSAPVVAKIDDDDRYGRHHLEDLLLALDYSGAEAVGKRRHAVHDVDTGTVVLPAGAHEERWEDHLPGATTLVRGETLRAVRWRHVPNAVDTELVRAIHLAGGACYSTHRFGFVRTRHGDHTYARGRFAGRALPGGLAGYLDV